MAAASLAEGLLDCGALLAWLLPAFRDSAGGSWNKISSRDTAHVTAAALLPLLQACIWVRGR